MEQSFRVSQILDYIFNAKLVTIAKALRLFSSAFALYPLFHLTYQDQLLRLSEIIQFLTTMTKIIGEYFHQFYSNLVHMVSTIRVDKFNNHQNHSKGLKNEVLMSFCL